MVPEDARDLELKFEKIRALWKYKEGGPHAKTVLSNKHLDCYFNSNFVCNKPKLVEELCSKYFVPYLSLNNIKPDWVITYLPYGLVFGFELAKQIGAKFAYVDLSNPKNMKFGIMPGERALVVADDIYSGRSVRDTISIISQKKALVERVVMAFANMTNSQKLDDMEIYSLIAPEVRTWKNESDSPLPKDSVGLSARENWEKLVGSETIEGH